jgi:protein SPT2
MSVMTSFEKLMALSNSQTAQQEKSVEQLVLEKKRREEQQRKAKEAKEAKEREQEKQRRLRIFEQEKREKEVQEKRERERAAKEAERLRREEEQRDALRYGPKKAKNLHGANGAAGGEGSGGSKWPTSSSSAKEDVRRQRRAVGGDDGDDDGSLSRAYRADAEPLTREEKRERRMMAEQRRFLAPSKRPMSSTFKRRPGSRLPGGAVDLASSKNGSDADSKLSVRQRLMAAPNTLTKLNTEKRDLRTIDEITADLKKAKVLSGDNAKGFNDWFPDKKKKAEPASKPQSLLSTPAASTPSKSLSPAPPPRELLNIDLHCLITNGNNFHRYLQTCSIFLCISLFSFCH